MKRLVLILAVLLSPVAADAQLHVEIRGGGTIGSLSSSRAGLEIVPNVSFNALTRYDLTSLFAVYGGIGRLAFGCENDFCSGSNPTISSSHAMIGAVIGWRMLWARAGGLIGMMGVGGLGVRETSDVGFGVQALTGVRFGIYRLECLPGVALERMQVGKDWATAISVNIGFAYPLM